MFSDSREIARALRDVLAQHRDVFSASDPSETRQQILARFPEQGGKFQDYLRRIRYSAYSKQLLVPNYAYLVRDSGNLLTFRGHSSEVLSVAALPAGRAISSGDKTLRLWDLASGQCLRVLEGHSGPAIQSAALPDGRAISASDDHTLRLRRHAGRTHVCLGFGRHGPVHRGKGNRASHLPVSPTVVAFGVVLASCVVGVLPSPNSSVPAALVGGIGLLGLVYSALIWHRMVRNGLVRKIDLEDRIWYAVAPALAYVGLTVSGVAFALASEAAAPLLAAGICLLLLAGIRNAWDMTTWAVLRRRD
jgi:hypothetical protein